MTEPDDLTKHLTRRSVLAMLGVTGVVAGGGYGVARALFGSAGGDPGHPATLATPTSAAVTSATSPTTTAAIATAPAPVADRVLVVIELEGGNDGLSMVVPTGDPRLRTLRPSLAVAEDRLIDLGNGLGLHEGLGPLHDRGLMIVQGVGSAHPDGSHFEMRARWWKGNSDTALDSRTGFLGRLCDQLDEGAPITGVSLGQGPSPALEATDAATIGINDAESAWFLSDPDPWFVRLRTGMASMAVPSNGDSELLLAAHSGLDDALSFGRMLTNIDEIPNDGYPDSSLASALRGAAVMLDARTGVRVIHIPTGGYDTHSDQANQHDALMADLGTSLAAFRDDLTKRGLGDRTLTVTTSEFGRRPEQNGSGTDHGTAGPTLLCGPIAAGVIGDAPRLDRLDDNGNLVAGSTIESYYASIAQDWFEIAADSVLPTGSRPIAGAVTV